VRRIRRKKFKGQGITTRNFGSYFNEGHGATSVLTGRWNEERKRNQKETGILGLSDGEKTAKLKRRGDGPPEGHSRSSMVAWQGPRQKKSLTAVDAS